MIEEEVPPEPPAQKPEGTGEDEGDGDAGEDGAGK